MKFPVLVCSPKGFTWLLKSEADVSSLPSGFSSIYRRELRVPMFFDSDMVLWSLQKVEPLQWTCWLWELLRPFAMIKVRMDFQWVRAFSLDEAKAALRGAVEKDDDLLTQHEEPDVILKRLEKARHFPDVIGVYRWMIKDFAKKNA